MSRTNTSSTSAGEGGEDHPIVTVTSVSWFAAAHANAAATDGGVVAARVRPVRAQREHGCFHGPVP